MAATAQLVCLQCPVRKQCDEYKEATQTEYGIWGGKLSKRGKSG